MAYRRTTANNEAIWISTITGDPPVRLANEREHANQYGPTWSPDGNSLAYFSMRNGAYVTMRAKVGAIEEAVVIARNAGIYPKWSPRGDWIASIATTGLTLVKPEGDHRKDVSYGKWLVHGWAADGSVLYGIRKSEKHRLELISLRPEEGAETVIADLGSYPAAFSYGAAIGSLPLQGFALASDGRSFVTSIFRPKSDLWIMEKGQQ